VVLVG